jgi:hypothetical protein
MELFSLAWMIPLILDSMVAIAVAVFDFFVGTGIIYAMIWGWLGFSIGLYLVKMYFPKQWVELFALSGGGQMYEPATDGWSISKDVAKPLLRAAFAIVVLLQIKPGNITYYVIDPFLEFGGVYVSSITKTIISEPSESKAKCSKDTEGYMSAEGCAFIVQSVHDVSEVSAHAIRKGFEFMFLGFKDGIWFADRIINGFLNIITGLFLVVAFFSGNLFMALLIIQGVIKFGMALIAYPFRVLIYVVKTPTKEEDKFWINPWPAFEGIFKSLQKLIIAMIAVAFLVLVNLSVSGVMFNFTPGDVKGFGEHSVGWLTAVMTFLLMYKVFELTREQLDKYVDDKDMTGFYDKVAKGTTSFLKQAGKFGGVFVKIIQNRAAKKPKTPAPPPAPGGGGGP